MFGTSDATLACQNYWNLFLKTVVWRQKINRTLMFMCLSFTIYKVCNFYILFFDFAGTKKKSSLGARFKMIRSGASPLSIVAFSDIQCLNSQYKFYTKLINQHCFDFVHLSVFKGTNVRAIL